jgi:SAM-dependent methyltransferase
MDLRSRALRAYWLLVAQFGLDPRKMIRSFRGLPRYLRDFATFRKEYKGRIEFVPCLHDWYEEGGSTKDEYFWQDLLVARMIFEARPDKHVDIGSRVDGFVAHVASFRQIELFDIRPITTRIPGVTFRQSDLMSQDATSASYCDSLSCLHALEHFGLGRYGDPIDAKGLERGLANMARLLAHDGVFYLSLPIGAARVEFNANRVCDPRAVVDLCDRNGLNLTALTVIEPGGTVVERRLGEWDLADLASRRYSVGIFVFVKSASVRSREPGSAAN